MRRVALATLVLAVTYGFLMLFSPQSKATQSSPVTFRFSPREDDILVNSYTTVDVVAGNASSLYGVDLNISFDANLFYCSGPTPGPLLPNSYVARREVNNSSGRLHYLATLLGDAAATGDSGVVVSFRLTGRSTGGGQLAWGGSMLSDRESNLLVGQYQGRSIRVKLPTATPERDKPPEDIPVQGTQPEAASTETPTPTMAIAPEGTASPTVAAFEPTATVDPNAAPTPTSPVLEPTLGPLTGVIYPTILPTGVPEIEDDGIMAILEPTPGVGVVDTSIGGADVEIRVDNQGNSMAVRLQPIPTLPPGVNLPAGTEVAKIFTLDLYRYQTDSNSVQRIEYGEGRSSPPIVLKWGVTEDDFNRTVDEDGVPHPDRLVFYRLSSSGELVKIPTVWSPDPPPYGTLTAVFVDRSTFILAVLPLRQAGRTIPADPRYFRETGYRIGRDAFWDYFLKRGGVRTFGYPISREFTFLGFTVQFFQRGVMQLQPDGGVTTMNLLDGDLMPYTRVNSSTFPAPDRFLIDSAPSVGDPEYPEQVIAFLQAHVPNSWQGLPVNFLDSYLSTVRYEDAFPQGEGSEGLLPSINLEMWGLPTSKPKFDPRNHNFVYQRFQRGIMHYDATTGLTQGLLLGDYFKSIITGWGLPADLEGQAIGSRFYRQYERGRSGYIARPGQLLGSDLVGAFELDMPWEIVYSESEQ
ncbi:MAG: cohesin domain-containing protein [Chloroflexota bacterium]